MNQSIELICNGQVFILNLSATLAYDESEKNLKLLDIQGDVKKKIIKNNWNRHTIGKTEEKYNIITLGSKGYGKLIPIDNDINIEIYYNDKLIEELNGIKTHSTKRGRIDGLSKIYKKYNSLFREEETFSYKYDLEKKLLIISFKYI